MMDYLRSSRRGLTLVELLAVVAIIGVLMALTLPSVLGVREAARRTQCRSRLRQSGVALHAYYTASGRFPAAAKNEWSWIARLLPYFEQHHLYDQLDFSLDPFIPPNDEYSDAVLPVLLCPNDALSAEVHAAPTAFGVQVFGHANFMGTLSVGASQGMFPREKGLRMRDVTDGTSRTLFVGERAVVADGGHTHGWWVWGINGDTYLTATAGLRPGSDNDHASAFHFWSHHSGGAHFLFVDGSVQMLGYEIDPVLFKALATRNGREVVTLDH